MLVPVITIDGPSGSGKGAISQLLARRLNWHLLDSGAIYRILAYAALELGMDLQDAAALAGLAPSLKIEFKHAADGGCRIIWRNRDITEAIRSEKCSMAASAIAVLPAVRAALLVWQRSFRQSPGLVADGRDMGTVVFPDAALKLFLTASVEQRAKRRYKQLKLQGLSGSLPDVLQDLIARDERDEKRAIAPLKPAKDAHIIDTTDIGIDDVLVRVVS